MKYPNLDLGTIEAVFNKLGGIEGAQAFLRGEQKLVSLFKRNKHGHIILTVAGLDLNGVQEIKRLEGAGYRVSDCAKSCLCSKRKDGYDAMHTLVPNRQYKVVLMPTKEIERDVDRTTENLCKRGIEKYGYLKPPAGIMPRIRDSVSSNQMRKMEIWYITALHDPIGDLLGKPLFLSASYLDDGILFDAFVEIPVGLWNTEGCIAFLLPPS